MHICKLQSLMCFARNWQNFVRPRFRVFSDLEICRHLPVPGFMRSHLVNQLFFERLDLCLELVLSQRFRHLWKEGIYSIIIPKTVEGLLMYAATARQVIA